MRKPSKQTEDVDVRQTWVEKSGTVRNHPLSNPFLCSCWKCYFSDSNTLGKMEEFFFFVWRVYVCLFFVCLFCPFVCFGSPGTLFKLTSGFVDLGKLSFLKNLSNSQSSHETYGGLLLLSVLTETRQSLCSWREKKFRFLLCSRALNSSKDFYNVTVFFFF